MISGQMAMFYFGGLVGIPGSSPLLSLSIKATVRITGVQAGVGSYYQYSLCLHRHMEAGGQPQIWFLWCFPSSLETWYLTGLGQTDRLGLLMCSAALGFFCGFWGSDMELSRLARY